MAVSKSTKPESAKPEPTALDGVPITDNMIAQRFTSQVPDEEAKIGMERINKAAAAFAQIIRDNCPRNERTATAIDKVQEARSWANLSIVLRGRV